MGAVGEYVHAAYTIWLREIWRFARERERIVGMIAQPLLYLLVIGRGIASTMGIRGAPAGLDYVTFMYPGILGMSILFTSVFSAVSVIWDREFGFLKEVLVAPVPRGAVALGKALGGATVTTLQAAILLALAPLAGIPLTAAAVAQMLGLAFLLALALTSFGLAVASRMASMQGFQAVMNFLIMPLFFLSGAMFPLTDQVPTWMRVLMHLDPLTYGVDALRHALYTGPLEALMRQAQLIRFDLGTDVAVLFVLAAAMTALGTVAFSRVR
ncbi:MAG: ABC transporter [Bacillota bacterium]|uniref:ABC transporter permease n=1 Tax=Thermaerobacter sp. FW80 TaxID=2546351 RepID=UPI000DB39E4E|nr:ABC transporter permease [Thermaerobacter sp. FW80]PZN06213.1 MAG: ABC transporter [Bacillota bacterium]